jgi:Fe-S cluster biogenesis protein NfuA
MVTAHSGSSTACQSSARKQDNLKSKTFSIIVYILNSTKMVKVNLMSETVEERVKKALEHVRPQLQADGGDIEYVGFDNGIVKVKMKGACNGCPMATMTLQWGVENFLKKRIPEVTKVEAVQ